MVKLLRKNLIFALIAALLLPILVSLAPDARALDDPAILAESALLVDMDAGAVLYSLNENLSRAPASLTKIMTVLLAVEACDQGDLSLDDYVEVTEDAFYDVTADGTTAGLKVGEKLRFEDLLYCALMASANESCNVIATAVSGSPVAFVQRMNERAQELGCKDTNFINTHGLTADGHYTSAYDIYLITEEALKHNLIKRIVSSTAYTVPATEMSEERILTTTNSMITSGSAYYYEFASGVKTGYTDAAGYCLVATATKEGRRLLSVVMGAKSVVLEDGRTQVQSYSETKRLLEWGFDNFSKQELLSTLTLVAEVPVKLGLGATSVVLRPEKAVTALLPNDVDLSQVHLDTVLYDDSVITAPVEPGRVLGEVTVTFNDVDYGTVNLVANSKIELDRIAYVGSELRAAAANRYVRLTFTVVVVLLILYVAFILYYNVRRRNKRRVADALARQRIERFRRSQEITTGKSFEEIEAAHARRQNTPR